MISIFSTLVKNGKFQLLLLKN